MPAKTTRSRRTEPQVEVLLVPRDQVTRSRRKAAPDPDRPKPLVDLTADAFDPEAVGTRFLCELGGVEYHIPAQQPAGVLWQYIEIERTEYAERAMWWLFEFLLGTGFVEALRDYKGLTKQHLRALQMACVETLTGPKG